MVLYPPSKLYPPLLENWLVKPTRTRLATRQSLELSIQYEFFVLLSKPVDKMGIISIIGSKGNLVERQGRKATGLQRSDKLHPATAAEPPDPNRQKGEFR